VAKASPVREFQQVPIDCLPQYQLDDGFEFVALHFALAEIIQAC
jgi:hypothetical protein